MSGAVNINTIGTATTTIGNILSTTNISGSAINMSGSVTIGTSGSTTTLNGTTYINKIDTITPTNSNSIFESLTTGNLAIADNIKGNILIGTNTTAGTNNFIIIGKGGGAVTGTTNTYIKGKGVYLADDGGIVGIGNSAGSITIYSPLTPQYPISTLTTNNLASLSYKGGAWTIYNQYIYTINTTYTAYVPLNNIPNGQYMFQVYVFTTANSTTTEISCTLCYSNSAMSNGQTTGFYTLFGNEIWSTTSTIGRFSLSGVFMQDVASPGNSVAVACRANSTLSVASIFYIKGMRIA
jgi:hypothetical protein